MIDNIHDFKDHATAIIGLDLSEFFDYLIHKYQLSKFNIAFQNDLQRTQDIRLSSMKS